MATGRPILYIGEEDSEIAICVRKYNIGWVVRPNDSDALKTQIENIVRDRNQLKNKSMKAREVAENVFSKNVVLEQYFQYIKNQND